MDKGKVSKEELEKIHQQFQKDAIVSMKKYPRIILSDEQEDDCITDLHNKIEDAYNSYKEENKEGKLKIIIKEATELASDFIVPISSGIAGCAGIVCHIPLLYTASVFLVCGWGIAKCIFYFKKEKSD